MPNNSWTNPGTDDLRALELVIWNDPQTVNQRLWKIHVRHPMYGNGSYKNEYLYAFTEDGNCLKLCIWCKTLRSRIFYHIIQWTIKKIFTKRHRNQFVETILILDLFLKYKFWCHIYQRAWQFRAIFKNIKKNPIDCSYFICSFVGWQKRQSLIHGKAVMQAIIEGWVSFNCLFKTL